MRPSGSSIAAHGLRGGDAVHLASFEAVLAAAGDDEVSFSCADARLVRAASSPG